MSRRANCIRRLTPTELTTPKAGLGDCAPGVALRRQEGDVENMENFCTELHIPGAGTQGGPFGHSPILEERPIEVGQPAHPDDIAATGPVVPQRWLRKTAIVAGVSQLASHPRRVAVRARLSDPPGIKLPSRLTSTIPSREPATPKVPSDCESHIPLRGLTRESCNGRSNSARVPGSLLLESAATRAD